MISTEFNWEINAIEDLRSAATAKEAKNCSNLIGTIFFHLTRQMSHTIKISEMNFWIRIFNEVVFKLKKKNAFVNAEWEIKNKLAKFKKKKSLCRYER